MPIYSLNCSVMLKNEKKIKELQHYVAVALFHITEISIFPYFHYSISILFPNMKSDPPQTSCGTYVSGNRQLFLDQSGNGSKCETDSSMPGSLPIRFWEALGGPCGQGEGKASIVALPVALYHVSRFALTSPPIAPQPLLDAYFHI